MPKTRSQSSWIMAAHLEGKQELLAHGLTLHGGEPQTVTQ